MKILKLIIGIVLVLAVGKSAWSQTISSETGQYFTLQGIYQGSPNYNYSTNNFICVPANTAVAIVSFTTVSSPSTTWAFVVTGGVTNAIILPQNISPSSPFIIAGPALINNIIPQNSYGYIAGNYLLTYKYIPQAADVNKTLIIPPGTNNVSVRLQSSTDLVNWLDATNGLYGGTNVAQFFRINMQSASQ